MKTLKQATSAFVVLLSLLILPFSCADEGNESLNPNEIIVNSLSVETPLRLSKVQDGEWRLQNESEAQLFFKRKFPEISERLSSFQNFQINVNPESGTVASITAMGYDELGRNVPVGFNIEPVERETGFSNGVGNFLNGDSNTKTIKPGFFTGSLNSSETDFILGETHTCAGDPCNSCSFVYGGGKIIGCKCNVTYGECNHTVTSGG